MSRISRSGVEHPKPFGAARCQPAGCEEAICCAAGCRCILCPDSAQGCGWPRTWGSCSEGSTLLSMASTKQVVLPLPLCACGRRAGVSVGTLRVLDKAHGGSRQQDSRLSHQAPVGRRQDHGQRDRLDLAGPLELHLRVQPLQRRRRRLSWGQMTPWPWCQRRSCPPPHACSQEEWLRQCGGHLLELLREGQVVKGDCRGVGRVAGGDRPDLLCAACSVRGRAGGCFRAVCWWIGRCAVCGAFDGRAAIAAACSSLLGRPGQQAPQAGRPSEPGCSQGVSHCSPGLCRAVLNSLATGWMGPTPTWWPALGTGLSKPGGTSGSSGSGSSPGGSAWSAGAGVLMLELPVQDDPIGCSTDGLSRGSLGR